MAKKQVNLNDELSSILADTVNSGVDGQVAFFLEGDESAPPNVSGWVSTGQSILDIAISNKPEGGLPVGRITELTGLEQTGKSLLAAHALAETQKKDGIAILIDTENAVNRDFYNAIGLDMSKLLYIQADTIEQVFEYVEKLIAKARSSGTDKYITIVVDSIAAASTKKEIEANYDKDGYATDKAIIISKALRKITNTIGREKIILLFTNQLRQNLNAMAFGDPYTTSGGKAIAFHSSVRIRLKKMKSIKKGDKVVGITVRAQLIKNRMGPPHTHADFDIYFSSGVDNYGSWLNVMKDEKLVKRSGAWFSYTDAKGEEHKFQSSTFVELIDGNPDLKDELYLKICNALITTYSKKKEEEVE